MLIMQCLAHTKLESSFSGLFGRISPSVQAVCVCYRHTTRWYSHVTLKQHEE